MTTNAKSRTPLKEKNIRRLTAVVAANLVAYWLFVRGHILIGDDSHTVFKGIVDLWPAGLSLILMSVVNGLVDPTMKARFVFWRWAYPLPGSRAFTVHVKRDPRINVPALRAMLGTFPKSEGEQNGVWYKLYRSIQSEPAVTHAHKEYLFTRDWTALAVMMVVVLSPLAFWQATTLGQAATYVGVLILQYVILRSAAVNYGQRLVTTVLAIKSAGA